MAPLRLLVPTALEEGWGTSEPLLFLGEWCKRHDRRHVWSRRASETVPFHWDDRGKLARDYGYLKALHHRLRDALAAALNRFHGVECSVRYWQILLDPWLLSYVAAVFDRWECIRRACATPGGLELVALDPPARTPPFSYVEFLEAVFSDEWNQALYEDIVESEYAAGCAIRRDPAARMAQTSEQPPPAPAGRPGLLGRTVFAVDRALGRCIRRYDVVFIGSTFSLPALARINLALGQVPRLFLREFGAGVSAEGSRGTSRPGGDRRSIAIDWQAESRFEQFLARRIVNDLPACLVEQYDALRARARRVGIATKAIVTGSSHWGDVAAKFWFAEQVEAGTKLVIAEHGGSLPTCEELFDFEIDIADAKATWFEAYHAKHTQLPPAKIVGRFPLPERHRGAAPYCAVIASECARWVHRAHYYPMAGQWAVSFEMIVALHAALRDDVRDAFRVKPYPSDEAWNTRQRFVDALGEQKVFSERSLDRVFSLSRVIVCSYPETTFAEAIASGRPTLLVYPPDLYELHAAALPLLRVLLDARIVFQDAASAAAHLNGIWDDPHGWWDSAQVRAARTRFQQQAIDLTGDWVGKWTRFLSAVAAT